MIRRAVRPRFSLLVVLAFLVGLAWTTVVVARVYAMIVPPVAYEVVAYWPKFQEPAMLVVQGTFVLRHPCTLANVTSYYVGDGEQGPERAVRVWHTEQQMIGRSTVRLRLQEPGVYPLVSYFRPPSWATAIQYRLSWPPGCQPPNWTGEERIVGTVAIPPRPSFFAPREETDALDPLLTR